MCGRPNRTNLASSGMVRGCRQWGEDRRRRPPLRRWLPRPHAVLSSLRLPTTALGAARGRTPPTALGLSS